jgi:AraC family transcriptional regulator, transcriptional activator of pobA
MIRFIDPFNTIGFSAHKEEKPEVNVLYQGREAYYRLLLLSGVGEINYEHKTYQFDGPLLVISKPGTHCSWRFSQVKSQSFVCIFKEEFLNSGCFNWVDQSEVLFLSTPIFILTIEQESFVGALFCRIVEEQKTSYSFKNDLIQNQICILMHTAFRIVPSKKLVPSPFSLSFSSVVFLELIERQFLSAGQVLHLN